MTWTIPQILYTLNWVRFLLLIAYVGVLALQSGRFNSKQITAFFLGMLLFFNFAGLVLASGYHMSWL